ncbi:MAG: hypothetical protein HZA07_01530 [Nitrospirae bacterium]|nr:hypothetical protein [Nitrospirota bacterium]
MSSKRDICVVCAWRADCQKRFSMKAGQRCPDFVRDVSLKEEEEVVEKKEVKKD